MTAIKNPTRQQIRQLLDASYASHDFITADLCNIVLDGEDSDGRGTTLGRPCTLAEASAEIARVLSEQSPS